MIQTVLNCWKKLLEIRKNSLFSIYMLCLLTGFIYLIWRTLFTIDFSQGIIGSGWAVLLLIAEIYTFIMFSLFSLASISKNKSSEAKNIKNLNYFPTVDIFVCTYNESESILLDTLTGCLNIKYPNKKIYLLDDGNRENIKNLADKLGCSYISRKNNKGFKAGNINNALKHTDGEFIVIFDADHIPVSTFLMELVDNFMDDQVALVQTPQHFFNPDPFQKNLSLHKYISNEQDLFFRVIQPGLSTWNATICSGTNFIVRREYLEKLGGIPESTITEDMDLGLRLQSQGYKVLYYNKPLAAGLAPETFKDYLNQRLRWAKGTIQIFLSKSKEYFSRLNLIQKSFYISSLLYYFFGFPRLIFLLSPIVFLLFEIKPVSALFIHMVFFQTICYSTRILLFKRVAHQKRNSFFTDIYEASIAFFLSLGVLKALISPFSEKFKVTNKGIKKAKNDYILLLPQFLILVFAFAGLIKGSIDYFGYFANKNSILLNLFWNLYNIIILAFSVKVVFEKADPRKDQRVNLNINTRIQNSNIEIDTCLINLSKTGALLFSKRDKSDEFESIFNTESYLNLTGSEKVEIKLVNSYEKNDKRYYHVKFNEKDLIDHKILKIMYENSENWV